MRHDPIVPEDVNGTLHSELVRRETGFWTGGPDYYREHLSPACLMVIEGMAGMFSSAEIARTIKADGRWRDVNLDVKAVLRPGPDFVILVYSASATGASGQPYSALVSSGYERRQGKWTLAFHQQTPVNAAASAPSSAV